MASAPRIALLLLAAAYLAWPNARPDLSALNADDSEAYLALSYALTHGFGYTRSLVAGLHVPHTTWPPGMAVLLAPLMVFMGLPINWLAAKLYMAVLGLGGLGLAWVYVRRLTGSVATADIAALLLGLMPFYWFFSHAVMSEVPSIGCILAALILFDRVWARRRPAAWLVALAGCVAGLAMLLRGTNIGLGLVPLAYLVGERRALVSRVRAVWLLGLHGAGFALPALGWALRNGRIDRGGLGFDGIDQTRMLLATNPLDPTSRLLSLGELVHVDLANLAYEIVYRLPEQIIPGLWVGQWHHWPAAFLLAAMLSLALALAAAPWRATGLPVVCVLVPNVAILLVYQWGGAVRFWLPVSALLLLLIAVNARGWRRMSSRRGFAVALSVLVVASAADLAVFAKAALVAPPVGDLADLLVLFERVGADPARPAAVDTPHPAVLTMLTGIAAPLSVPARGILPLYSHVISCPVDKPAPTRLPVPRDAVLLIAQGGCFYYRLAAPMTASAMADAAR